MTNDGTGEGARADGGDPRTLSGDTRAHLAAGDERMRAMFTLYDAIEQMLETDSETETVEVVLDAAVEVLGLAQTGIHRYDEAERALVPVVWSGSLEDELGEPPALGPDSTAWSVYEDGTTLRVEDYWSEGDHHNPDTEFRSEVIVPLGEYGVLLSASPEPAEFDDLDERFLEVLCANAADALDRLDRRDRLERREAELARQREVVGDLVETLRDSFEDISTAATGISERSRAIDDHSDEQVDSVGDVASAISEMSAMTEQLAALADQTRESSARATDITEAGRETVADTRETMTAIGEQTTAAAEDFEQLRTHIAEIDEIVEVITGVADQTNMLALNASIEAARADNSEGFAVIADEVKALAEETAAHTSEIEQLAEQIQSGAAETVTTLSTAAEQAERGVDQIEQTDEQFEQIVTRITETADAIEEVATAADEQAQTIQEVSSFVDDTEEVAHTISTDAEAIAGAAREQAEQIDRMETELAETERELE